MNNTETVARIVETLAGTGPHHRVLARNFTRTRVYAGDEVIGHDEITAQHTTVQLEDTADNGDELHVTVTVSRRFKEPRVL
jgi:hypothetical protein